MTQRSIPPRTPTQAIKALISTAAVAAMLSGWALLAVQSRTAAVDSDPLMVAPPAETAQPPFAAPLPAWLMAPPPIPTLQPLSAVVQAPGLPAPEPVVVNRAAPVSVNPTALRKVSAPVAVSQPQPRPIPVVTTRSSR